MPRAKERILVKFRMKEGYIMSEDLNNSDTFTDDDESLKWYEKLTKKVNLIDFYIEAIEIAIANEELTPEDAPGRNRKEYIHEHKALVYARHRGNTNTPALSIYQTPQGKWKFFDYGTSESGTIFQLAPLLYNFEKDLDPNMTAEERALAVKKRVSNFLFTKFFKKGSTEQNYAFQYKEKDHSKSLKATSDVKMEVTALFPEVTHEGAIKYLKSRGIEHVPSWIKQAQYKVTKTTKSGAVVASIYQAVCVENIRGGINHRNDKVKGAIGHNALTHIDNKKQKTIWVEGMFDAASAYQYFKDTVNYVILNSTSNIIGCREYIKANFKNSLNYLFLDNDGPGLEGESNLYFLLSDSLGVKKLQYSSEYSDPNDLLQATGKIAIDKISAPVHNLYALKAEEVAILFIDMIHDARADENIEVKEIGEVLNAERVNAAAICKKQIPENEMRELLDNPRIASLVCASDKRFALLDAFPEKYKHLSDLSPEVLLGKVYESAAILISNVRKNTFAEEQTKLSSPLKQGLK